VLSGSIDPVILARVTVADDHLAEVGADLDAWSVEAARDLLASVANSPAHEREALLLRRASHPMASSVIRLAGGPPPGWNHADDAEWAASLALARRQVLANRSAGLDAGMTDRSLRLLDWLQARIRVWPESEWQADVRHRVEGLVEATRRGRRRGQQLRHDGGQKRPPGIEVGWILRHPADHYFFKARTRATSPDLREQLDEWITAFAPSYQALVEQDWTAEQNRADLVVELQLGDGVPPDWTESAPAVVRAVHRGNITTGSELRLRQVEDPDAAIFNGTLLSLVAGEFWLVCARYSVDGTVIPLDGSRRLLPSLVGLEIMS
jgi:hypothetical protein